MTYLKPLGLIFILAACQPVTPNDFRTAGDTGFADSARAAAEREAALTGNPVNVVPLDPTIRSVPVDASPSNPAPSTIAVQPLGSAPTASDGSVDISDENSFDAVSGRETIESDAARLAANRQQYAVVEVTGLPSRPGQLPNIVDYALATNNPVGTQLYRRIGLNKDNRALRKCAAYASSDMAQQDFLANGGPTRDRIGLDPDGDGYACKWNPAPFRLVRQAAQ